MYSELMQLINGSMSLVFANKYGSYDPNTGKWSDLFGMLQSHSADFALSSFFLVDSRIAMLQYLLSTHMLDAYFVFRRPSFAVADNVFLAPFDRWVWVCTGIILLILVAVVAAVMSFATSKHRVPNSSLAEAFVLVVGAACQQGTTVKPQSPAGRLVIVCAFVSLMFLFTSYSACIVVLLQSPSNQIQTLQQLYDSRLTMALHNNTWNVQVFSVSYT